MLIRQETKQKAPEYCAHSRATCRGRFEGGQCLFRQGGWPSYLSAWPTRGRPAGRGRRAGGCSGWRSCAAGTPPPCPPPRPPPPAPPAQARPVQHAGCLWAPRPIKLSPLAKQVAAEPKVAQVTLRWQRCTALMIMPEQSRSSTVPMVGVPAAVPDSWVDASTAQARHAACILLPAVRGVVI